MSKFYIFFTCIFLFFILPGCSIDSKTGIWKNLSEESTAKKRKEGYKQVFTKQDKFREEISNDLPIKISKIIANDIWLEENFSGNNFVPHLAYENKKNLIFKSKKISKIKHKISSINSEPLFFNGNIIFSDRNGTIYMYSVNRDELLWKFNFYKKRYKKFFFIINLFADSDHLYISDNIGYIYKLQIDNGKLLWAKNYGVPFRSNIKGDLNYLFLTNQDNKFYVINKSTGEKKLDFETFPSFLKHKYNSSITLDPFNKNVYFITSAGEIYSMSYKTFTINWLYKITIRELEKKTDLFFSSPIIYDNDSILLSTSASTVLVNSVTGTLEWQLPFSTPIRPIISNDNIFMTSEDGFILNINKSDGKVIWSKELFNISPRKFSKNKIGKINSLILISDQIFITTTNGYFLFLNYQNGEIINYAKVDGKGFFSKPILVDGKIYIINGKKRILAFN